MVDNLNSKGRFLATFKSGYLFLVRDMSGICQGFICLDMGGHPVLVVISGDIGAFLTQGTGVGWGERGVLPVTL